MSLTFISYAEGDLHKAREVYEYLAENGHRPWLDDVELFPGQAWEQEIRRAIRSSDVFIACLSARSVDKRGIFRKELKKAFELLAKFPERQVFTIPLRFDKCEVPEQFRVIHHLDWFHQDARPKLLQTIALRTQNKSSEKGRFIILQGLMKLKSITHYVYADLQQAVKENKNHTDGSRIRKSTLHETEPVLNMLKQYRLLDYSLVSASGEILQLHPSTLEPIDRVHIKNIDTARLRPLIEIVQDAGWIAPDLQ